MLLSDFEYRIDKTFGTKINETQELRVRNKDNVIRPVAWIREEPIAGRVLREPDSFISINRNAGEVGI